MLTLIFRVTTGIATVLIESGRENAFEIGDSRIMNSFNTYDVKTMERWFIQAKRAPRRK
jgi:hypothetical protein